MQFFTILDMVRWPRLLKRRTPATIISHERLIPTDATRTFAENDNVGAVRRVFLASSSRLAKAKAQDPKCDYIGNPMHRMSRW